MGTRAAKGPLEWHIYEHKDLPAAHDYPRADLLRGDVFDQVRHQPFNYHRYQRWFLLSSTIC